MDFFDLHCDTALECYKRNCAFSENDLAISGKNSAVFNSWYQCFAVFINDGTKEPFELYKSVLCDFKEKLNPPENLHPIFTVEGGLVIENDIKRLETLKEDGIKAVALTWNGENQIASGVDGIGGLKPFGKDVIREMNTLNIACDLSHLNEESFFDCLELGDTVFASHSCCKSVFHHKRNLSDTQLKLIAQKDGVVGICFYPVFLGGDNVFNKIYENICLMLDLGLENNISIGSDFDGCVMSDRLCKIAQIPDLYYFLEGKGINKVILNKIFFKNALNFFSKL